LLTIGAGDGDDATVAGDGDDFPGTEFWLMSADLGVRTLAGGRTGAA